MLSQAPVYHHHGGGIVSMKLRIYVAVDSRENVVVQVEMGQAVKVSSYSAEKLVLIVTKRVHCLERLVKYIR